MSNIILRIFPLPEENRYFNVRIYDSRIDHLNYLYQKSIINHYQFIPFGAAIEYEDKHQMELGTISFSKNRYHISVIFHECLHAAIWYLKRSTNNITPFKNWTITYDADAHQTEERLCSIQEYLFWQIYHAAPICYPISLKEAVKNCSAGVSYYNYNKTLDDKKQQIEFDFF
jgi:hypothetical protein